MKVSTVKARLSTIGLFLSGWSLCYFGQTHWYVIVPCLVANWVFLNLIIDNIHEGREAE